MILKRAMGFLGALTLLFVPQVNAADVSEAKNALQKNYQSVSSWKADFVQDTYVEMLEKTVRKKGEIRVKKPGRLKIIYTDPPQKTYLSNGKRLWVYSEGAKEVQVFKKISKLVASEALDFLNGLGELDRDFEVLSYEAKDASHALIKNKNLSLLELVPRDAESVLNRIVLGVNRKTGSVDEMTLFNESGNKTHYLFSNIELNADLPDAEFEFVKAKGMKEISQ